MASSAETPDLALAVCELKGIVSLLTPAQIVVPAVTAFIVEDPADDDSVQDFRSLLESLQPCGVEVVEESYLVDPELEEKPGLAEVQRTPILCKTPRTLLLNPNSVRRAFNKDCMLMSPPVTVVPRPEKRSFPVKPSGVQVAWKLIVQPSLDDTE